MKYYPFEEVLRIKKAVSEQFGLYLHFHDVCGSQYFSFDEPVSQTVQNQITAWFRTEGGSVHWSDTGDTFTVRWQKLSCFPEKNRI